MSTSTSAEPLLDGAARKARTPIGLLGLSVLDGAEQDEELPLRSRPPNQKLRFVKVALAVVLPVGIALAAHRASVPEGFDAAELAPTAVPAATRGPEGLPATPVAVGGPPSRRFTAGSFGHSGAVRVRVVLPGELLYLPIAFGGPTDNLQSQWIAFDGSPNDSVSTYSADGVLRAPARPGAFWLVLSRAGVADTVADLALLVEYPMPNSRATGINGYHLGRWPKDGGGTVPRGFVEVRKRLSDFPLSPHLRLSDFVVHDEQDDYPRYLHVREPLLDKIELVVSEVAQMRGVPASSVKLNVASGFRSPSYNGSLASSASDSRHMYGDAADIAIDANNDGRLTEIDARLVASAAEIVERRYPDLVGGIGLYITPDGAGWPYVHIDVRGTRARWRGGRTKSATVDSLPPGATFDTANTLPLNPAPAKSSPAKSSPAKSTPAQSTPAQSAPAARERSGAAAATPAAKPTPVAKPTPAPSTRGPDDPFSSAARKFRTARPERP